jgi:ribulose-phosphate 3-epimerase
MNDAKPIQSSTQLMRPGRVEFAPSILSADFLQLGQQVQNAFEAGVRRLHVDIMDGHFVPNLSMGPQVVRALRPLADRYEATLATHLMVSEPDRYLDTFASAGASAISVHVETCPHLYRTIRTIRSLGCSPGVALNPATPLAALEEVLDIVDYVLVMTVEPGFGGQELIPEGVNKIARLRRHLDRRGLWDVLISVDGGINEATAHAVAEAGADVLVAGSAIFNDRASIAENLAALRDACWGGQLGEGPDGGVAAHGRPHCGRSESSGAL